MENRTPKTTCHVPHRAPLIFALRVVHTYCLPEEKHGVLST